MSIYGLGSVKPPTKVIAEEVLAYLERNGTPLRPHPETGVPVVWGYSPGAEHGTGRALDFMVTADTSVGDVIADYVWTHRERLGLIHVIWRQRIKSTTVDPGVWRHMSDRGSPTENHMDHPHCFFDGRTVKPVNHGGAQSIPGSRPGPKPKPTTASKGKLTVDGLLGPATYKALQKAIGANVDGVWGPQARRMLQRHLKVSQDGVVGRRTIAALQRKVGSPADGIWGRATTKALQRALNKGTF